MSTSRTLRFSRSLYAGEAVDEACKRFARFASLEREQTGDAWVVTVTPKRPAQLRRLCGELANFALGLTIRRGATPTGSDAGSG